jgi:hypothetical protein
MVVPVQIAVEESVMVNFLGLVGPRFEVSDTVDSSVVRGPLVSAY